MTMTDIGDLEVGVTKGDGLEVVLLITAIEDRIVPESKCSVCFGFNCTAVCGRRNTTLTLIV